MYILTSLYSLTVQDVIHNHVINITPLLYKNYPCHRLELNIGIMKDFF